ncbi:DsbE family thiol:disulfide interchange protein [Propylenella binzhouense]|uniref:DsbE family thiol:disulfide interchange protein n=1 Tax=Propylenella binzhouense TaxID=2555902 RepID=A0A964WUQ2_9HYPH|nr:DsbE family thiol:disulfide interchange protein [Propylenella binzhouense]
MTETTPEAVPEKPGRFRSLWVLLPLLGFLALALLFYMRLGEGDPSRIPSALINKPVPDFSLPPIESGEGLSGEMLQSGVFLVNIWASWCAPCRAEHPLLVELAKDARFKVVGINYKDLPENAQRFLGALGNPYELVGADRDGRAAIDWGVYGVPETFIVRDGIIVHKFIGPLSRETVATDLVPALERALGAEQPAPR